MNNEKTQVYNLVILDKSGSMSSIAEAAIDGFNDIVEGICSAQKQFADSQEHYLSLLPFCGCSMNYLYECVPVKEAFFLNSKNYQPCCNTPLYDAMGRGINDLYKKTKDMDNATVIVTIITDGMENASREYRGKDTQALVKRMQDECGWGFAYIGTNQDVESVAKGLSIEKTMYFEDTCEGMSGAWEKERKSRSMMYGMMADTQACMPHASSSERTKAIHDMLRADKKYREIDEFAHRMTPYNIDHLENGQVFVFGSNGHGAHLGGAARAAVKYYGAIMGQGEGMQGDSYAINSMSGLDVLGEQARRFVAYAKEHPERTFLVTRIGCGIAGYTPREVAPLFVGAVDVENIWLPKDFWEELV